MEIGNPYAEPLGDRTKISDKLTTTFEIKLTLDNPAPQPLIIESSLEPLIQDAINFFTYISFKTPSQETRIIPKKRKTWEGTLKLFSELYKKIRMRINS